MAKYLVNHGGVVHSVSDEDFALHLGMASLKPTEENPAGKPAREATAEEVSAWFATQGLVYDPASGEAYAKDSGDAARVVAAQQAAAKAAEKASADKGAQDDKSTGDSKASK